MPDRGSANVSPLESLYPWCFGRLHLLRQRKLLAWLSEDDLIEGRKVIYRTLMQIQKEPPTVNDLPFLKRKAYEHEAEFRLLYSTKRKSVPFKNFVLPIDITDGVYLNPWLPIATFNAIKDVIQKIEGCEELEVMRATIIENKEWQDVATNAANA
jgi:hypothetical protein